MCNVICEWLEIADVQLGSSSSSTGTVRSSKSPVDSRVPDEFVLLQVILHTSMAPAKRQQCCRVLLVRSSGPRCDLSSW